MTNETTGAGRRSRGLGQEALAYGHLLYRKRKERPTCLSKARLKKGRLCVYGVLDNCLFFKNVQYTI